MRISDWSSDVCSSDLRRVEKCCRFGQARRQGEQQEEADRATLTAKAGAVRADECTSTPTTDVSALQSGTVSKDGTMIALSRLNGSRFALNSDLIERIDASPDTVITLVDGTKYLDRKSTRLNSSH